MDTKLELRNKLHEHFNIALRYYPPPPAIEVPIAAALRGEERIQNLLAPVIHENGKSFIVVGGLGKINSSRVDDNALFFQIHGVMLPNAAVFRTLWIISQNADVIQRGEYYNYFTWKGGVFRRASAANAVIIRDTLFALQEIETLDQEAIADLDETLNAISTIGELLLTLKT